MFAAAAWLAGAEGASAQPRFPLGPGPYDPDVPAVRDVRGFETGRSFSTYREIERVLDAIATASDRVRIETYGRSVEGRPLRIAWVSSPENLARLDELRAANAALSSGDRAIDPDTVPLFAWLSFGVHGDEGATPETALELLYHLAASRDPATAARLERTVVAIDPVLNPDGHERYAGWYRAVAGPNGNPSPAAREHRPPWAPGRTNHWLFDLNRDWAWGVMPETRARLAAYRTTLPQLHVDFHEMDSGSTYFFFPAGAPVHAFYPASTAAWGRIFGEANAAAFDARGWPYYTEERFDLFYPGYGDSWPSFFGATGMTYEQAGGSRAGVVLDRGDEDPLTLDERIEHHLVAALATLETVDERRAERLLDFVEFWRPATRRVASAPAAWLVPPSHADARGMARLLVRQGVEVDTLAEAIGTEGLTPFPRTDARDSLPAGTFVIDSDQPLGRYAAALMSPRADLADTTRFYDITGWSLPFLHDVGAWRAPRSPEADTGRWSAPDDPAPPPPPELGEAAAIAWSYRASDDVLAAAGLVARGVEVRVAERPFRAGGASFPRGSFVVLLDRVERPAAVWAGVVEAGARPVVLPSYRTDEGIDLGSDRIRAIRSPRIALASGPGTVPISTGAAWWLLDERAGLPVDVIRSGDLAVAPGSDEGSPQAIGRPLDLRPYTVVVLPDTPAPGELDAVLGAEGAERLAAWVREGGTLIGIRGAARWLTADHAGISRVSLAPDTEPDDHERRIPQAARERDARRSRIPGTLLAVTVDTTSALGYGFGDGDAAVLVRDPPEFQLAERGNDYVYADAEPLAGYLPADARERLPGTPYALVEESGEGRIVLFADDPGFRAILRGLRKTFLNAVLLVPGS